MADAALRLLAPRRVESPPTPAHAEQGCWPAGPFFAALGLPDDTRHLWLHDGPITHASTPRSLHGTVSSLWGGGGDDDTGHTPALTLSTPREYRAALGYCLAQLLLLDRPPGRVARACVAVRPPGLGIGWAWLAAGAVWHPEHGARLEWRAVPAARTSFDAARAADLLYGRTRRPGRRRLTEDETALAVAARAIAYKALHPSASWEQIAARDGLDERTLRRWRQAYAYIHDLPGGGYDDGGIG